MRIRIVDAFAEQAFAGNPAGVVVLAGEFPDEAWMQAVAAEVNHPETAFLRRSTDDLEADWELRWFTPTVEVKLCGHATLAAAHVLRTDGLLDARVRFHTRSGVLAVSVRDDGRYALDFPLATVSPTATPLGVAEALGAAPVSVHDTGTLGDLLVELADETRVRSLAPDFAALARLPWRGVIVTAPADAADGAYQFVSRFFAPGVGIPEDGVTGSAHTALAPFWSARLDRPRLTGYQASRRGGLVTTSLRAPRVDLIGSATTTLDGTLTV
jgi:PhzF family phenazine biosynthesis protein